VIIVLSCVATSALEDDDEDDGDDGDDGADEGGTAGADEDAELEGGGVEGAEEFDVFGAVVAVVACEVVAGFATGVEGGL